MPIRAILFDMYETLCSHYRCPLYFGAHMAEECGVAQEHFLPLWRNEDREKARTLGQLTLEEQLAYILPRCGITEEGRLESLIAALCRKRMHTKRECMRTLHPQIMPMLEELKAAGMKLGVISNCYHEEAQVIREWEGSRCFDTLVLSCEEGVCKPDPEIFRRCMERLGVMPQECLFVGDGGSRELETARSLGMEAMQAVWYMQGVEDHPSSPKKDFVQLEEPRDVLAAVCRLNGWTDALSENHCLPTKNESETAGRA